MFIYDFVPVRSPFSDTASWLHGAGGPALSDTAVALFSEAGTGRLRWGDVRERHDALLVPFLWSGGSDAEPSLRLEGDLQVAPLAPGDTHLSLSASYDPPAGVVTPSDVMRFQRTTEARVRSFLDRVARMLESAVPAR